MRQRGGRSVFCAANAEVLGNTLTQKFVHGGHVRLTIKLDEIVLLSLGFEFALNHRLIADERPVQIVRKGHVASGFPVADGLGFSEFAAESGFRANVEPEGKMRAQSHGVKAAEIIAVDAADDAACDEREEVTIGENYGSGL